MENWSGNINWTPSELHKPSSEEEIVLVVQRALDLHKTVRTIGSGHSFMPLSKTDDILVSLDNYQGLVSTNNDTAQVTVKAGTKLSLLNTLLKEQGLALANMGDINAQSIAGAISTGTHGTGAGFGNMSTQVVSVKMVNGLGSIITCSKNENPSIFKAAQISLGTLGIITEVTIQCVPLFKLELQLERLLLDDVLNELTALNHQHRNYEFFWFPNTPYVMTKKCNITDHPEDKVSISEYVHETLLENNAFKLILELSRLKPSWTNRLSLLSAKSITSHHKIKASYNVFSTPRTIKFNEMEYNVPMEAYKDVMNDITKWINKNNRDVLFPLENRFVQQDDIYLSPAYKRDSAYIAAHVYHKKDARPYFKALEEIYRAYEGRPHWGKINTLTSVDFRALYPQFDTFNNIRKESDPSGIFLSPYFAQIFADQELTQPV